ncbi:uncharacterized protein BCR38DRAFT_343583 [Pseudomassariella vexata]|uniref:HECT-type E3 ubiquitin transferase n=1 Tax=Pseudomassariella vexata TaxID=1141098 RepID=A0A1Y2DZC6_9PEZI|nr:uncharacterized protein BCR38DRAFT_343583 [Pseudomassariella vexata]ORY64454.1 hypothetical protein BCR38DRAFT_343583 [Pseudomassariella vexata]
MDVFRNPHGQLQHHAESSSTDDDDIRFSKPKPKSRPARHSRSMSHPITSLFSKKKKPASDGVDDDSTDDDTTHARGQLGLRTSMAPPGPRRRSADSVKGNCMTCGSQVSWPKEVDAFRCSICVTINDLKPFNPPRRDEKGSEPPRPISLEHTKFLVREGLRCALNSFLVGRAPKDRNGTSDAGPSGPLSRVAGDYFSQKQDRPISIHRSPPVLIPSPVFDGHTEVSFEMNPLRQLAGPSRSNSTSYPDARSSGLPSKPQKREPVGIDGCRIFKPLEDYLATSFNSYACINASFVARRKSFSSRPVGAQPRTRRQSFKSAPIDTPRNRRGSRSDPVNTDTLVSELDAKMLLVGDIAENGSWWTGGQEIQPLRAQSWRLNEPQPIANARSPQIDWKEATAWYHSVINAGESWTDVYGELVQKDPTKTLSELDGQNFEQLVLAAQEHLQRVLLKCTENFLKRPGRLLKEPQDSRFLLLFLANPLLLHGHKTYAGVCQHLRKEPRAPEDAYTVGRHSVIIKRILGILSHLPDPCHHHFVGWFSRLPEHIFLQIKDLVSSFVTYRLVRANEKRSEPKVDLTGGLIPQMPSNRSSNNAASLHAALGTSQRSNKRKPVELKKTTYGDDWQMKAGAQVMALVFAANNVTHVRRNEVSVRHAHGHLLATSDFYNTLLDTMDFRADFEEWESKKSKFSFCHYPFFLSIWTKIRILEFDAKRQMAHKAHQALVDSVLTHRNFAQYISLRVRRDCLVEDSLRQVSQVVGSGSEEIKKGLRIEFDGEEGVDAGGLRKEWFLLLVREVFNPDHGLFVFDEDSQHCYFNPHTFETSDQYFLVGVVLGLAIYHSTILDIALPPFAFRKLLAAAPAPSTGITGLLRPPMTYSLSDLREYRPRLAHGLKQLLEFEGDVESTFCRDFVIETEKYGTTIRTPLCPGGENMQVTNNNRHKFVELYVRYLLDTSVSRQFEPFKRGFFTVCAGNALSLFRPEEIELLVRGSDEPLDIATLRAVATYTNWEPDKSSEPELEPTVDWFWKSFAAASPADQRRLLSFITGSDRIPAMGAASLVIKINCLGDDIGRYPTAQTCFNALNLFRYRLQESLEVKLWGAVRESEGFGLR